MGSEFAYKIGDTVGLYKINKSLPKRPILCYSVLVMKKPVFSLYFVLILSLFVVATPAFADDSQTVASVGASTSVEIAPAILPTNPFYFAKEITREVRRFFTFGKVAKAKYELEVADEKAAELRELTKLAPGNVTGIKRALENYNENVELLKSRIEVIESTSTESESVDELLSTFAEKAAVHVQILQGIEKADGAIREEAVRSLETVDAAVIDATIKLDAPENVEARLAPVLEAKETFTEQAPVTEDQAILSTQITPLPILVR